MLVFLDQNFLDRYRSKNLIIPLNLFIPLRLIFCGYCEWGCTNLFYSPLNDCLYETTPGLKLRTGNKLSVFESFHGRRFLRVASSQLLTQLEEMYNLLVSLKRCVPGRQIAGLGRVTDLRQAAITHRSDPSQA